MKYHYLIKNGDHPVADSADIMVQRGEFGDDNFRGYSTEEIATKFARLKCDEYQLPYDCISIYPSPENVEEEDMLAGHPYPGHEMWPDEPDYSPDH